MLTKCDLLSTADLEKLQAEMREAIAGNLGSVPELIPVSSNASRLPTVDTWFEQTMIPQIRRFRAALIESAAGDAEFLRASLLATLDLKSDPASVAWRLGRETEEILRRVDECLSLFQQHWEKEFDRMSGWSGDILEHAASLLSELSAGADQVPEPLGGSLAAAFIQATVGRLNPFLKEYDELRRRVGADLGQLAARSGKAGIIPQKLPSPSGLPIPVTSPLQGVTITRPGATARGHTSNRVRHYRKELEEKAAGRFQQMFEEYQPRFRRWFLMTMNTLKESVRLQTDPLRYRSPASAPTVTDEILSADIAFLGDKHLN